MATKKGGGTTKNGRDSAGRRLGFKKFGGEYVEGGFIIIRQRGTKFHPGRNVTMGTDHTINAICEGFVHIRKRFGRQFIDVITEGLEECSNLA